MVTWCFFGNPLKLINQDQYACLWEGCVVSVNARRLTDCALAPAQIWWKRCKREEIKWRSEDGCIKDKTRDLKSLSSTEPSLWAPQLRTQEMNRTGWWYQTLLYNITFSSDKWPERENERLTEKTQWWKGTEGGKGRKISSRISSMPSTAKWGLSGEFDRIQLKAVVDKMMMNCSRAAERSFASDSTHQFLPKREGRRENELRRRRVIIFEEGSGKQLSYVGARGRGE